MTQTNFSPSKEALLTQLDIIKHQALGRSKNHIKLFEYLMQREIAALTNTTVVAPPKEIEIAIEVFNKDVAFNPADDSIVRVNISNLRKKLENYYIRDGKNAPFYIFIPNGSYCLAFKENAQNTEELAPQLSNQQAQQPANNTTSDINLVKNSLVEKKHWRLLFIISMIIKLGIVIYLVFPQFEHPKTKRPLRAINNHPIWSDFTAEKRTPVIIMGDIHNFVEIDNKTGHPRTIIDSHIPTEKSLKAFLEKHPSKSPLVAKSSVQILTKGSNIALGNIFNLLDNKAKKLRLSSEIDAYDFRLGDIIYIGPLNALGILEQYFKGSNFSLNELKNQLTLKSSNERFLAPQNLTDGYIDYGLFAKVEGPRGNRIYIISGFSDTSIMQISWYFTNYQSLVSNEFNQFIKQHNLNINNNFEVLFKVPSIKGVDMRYEIIYGGKLTPSAIWSSPNTKQ